MVARAGAECCGTAEGRGARRLEGCSVGDLVSGDAAGAGEEGGCGVPAIPASLMFCS